jgi:hypothetical protein
MCEACESDDDTPREPLRNEVVATARDIEAKMPGERVPEHAWAIFFSFAGGALEWRYFQRIRSSYDAALAAHESRAVSEAQPGTRGSAIRCEAVP